MEIIITNDSERLQEEAAKWKVNHIDWIRFAPQLVRQLKKEDEPQEKFQLLVPNYEWNKQQMETEEDFQRKMQNVVLKRKVEMEQQEI